MTFEDLVYQFLDRYQHFPLVLISDRCFSKVGYLVESNAFQGQKTQVFGSHPC